ncbi:helix-turn-helix transcriptional regulator [Leptolyngbya sp. FACHB-671]|uniref:helix-turn-helix domain-containing protein n=1 Tax=Leptolyngbya sp. FACHB-671 TaxID=2692812 RepID=UPI00168866D8|nr:helix-turn-helix transcriptional regulator [Leptolyngbya sp. FACHB-671]MBD2067691.1 helix-turn-helix transcriptional regulator [Leptolyngbya sp. FACHB-671]
MNPLKLRPEDCSAFGQLVLQYLQDNPQTNMSQLAKQVHISRAGLGWICLKRSGPDEETAKRISEVIGADLREVARLVHENKVENLSNLGGLNYVAKVNGNRVKRLIPVSDALAGLNSLYQAFHQVTRSVSLAEKPSEFQIYKQSFELLKAHLLKPKQRASKHSDSFNSPDQN